MGVFLPVRNTTDDIHPARPGNRIKPYTIFSGKQKSIATPNVRAIVFNVFGTAMDCHSNIACKNRALGLKKLPGLGLR